LAAIGRALGISHQRVQQILRRLDEQAPERFLICCACARPIASAKALPRDRSPALCLHCLADKPEIPFGARLKAFRLAAGLTTAELARKTGLEHSLVRRYEHGERHPRSGSLAKLIRILGDELMPPATGQTQGRE
jgi:DNA-binding transcriptional regulator YiaG